MRVEFLHRRNYLIAAVLVFVHMSMNVGAAVKQSVTDGNWSNKCTWDSNCAQNIPSKNDDVRIYHEVILDINLTGGNQVKGLLYIAENGALIDASGGSSFSMRIQNLGSLVIDGNVVIDGDFELQGNATLTVTEGSTLTIGSDATWSSNANVFVEEGATLNIEGNLDIAMNADSVQIDGVVNIGGDLTNQSGAEITGSGQINITGTVDNDGEIFGTQGQQADCTECTLPQALPVELVSFKGSKQEKGVVLTWVTAMEVNNSHFEVQRSVQAGIWNTIDRVQGQGNTLSKTNYQFVDPDAKSFHNVYYRLKQVDYDGSFAYSPTVSILDGSEHPIDIRVQDNRINISNVDQGLVTLVRLNGAIIERYPVHGPAPQQLDYVLQSGEMVLVLIELPDRRVSEKVMGY